MVRGAAPICVSGHDWSLTMMRAVLGADDVLSAATAWNVAAPCPWVMLSFTHGALLLAVQVQSRDAWTWSVARAPRAGRLAGPSSETEHLSASGPTSCVVDVPPQAIAASMRTSVSAERRLWKRS